MKLLKTHKRNEIGYYSGLVGPTREEMQVIRQPDALPALAGSVLTIGNFDGFHVGHQAIFEALGTRARALGLPVAAITFEPHPLTEIAPSRAPLPLSTPAQRIRRLESAGVDILLVQTFDREFSRLSPEDFIHRYLVELFRARVVGVGHNFRFGREHRGTIDTLKSHAADFEVIEVPPVLRWGEPVSSSRVRAAVAAGEVGRARRLLGRCYEIEGSPAGGTGRGRSETVPTLNMKPQNALIPGHGVYISRLAFDREAGSPVWLDSVTNIGTRPTFNGHGLTIETHVLDRTLGEDRGGLRLKFLRRLRDEERFSNSDTLRDQILRDIETARRYFRRLAGIAGCVPVERAPGKVGND